VLRATSLSAIGKNSLSYRFSSASSVRSRSDVASTVRIGIVDKRCGDLASRQSVAQDLDQLAHQHVAIARVLAGDPDPRNGSRIGAAAEGHHVPGGAAARNVPADQGIIRRVASSGAGLSQMTYTRRIRIYLADTSSKAVSG
jgi:hypothetical protein